MPNIDLSLAIALAALLFSVLSPVVSSLIDSKARRREKELEFRIETEKRNQEFYEQHRAEVIERYLKYAGKACKSAGPTSLGEFGASMGEMYFYVDESLWPLLDAIESKLKEVDFSPPSKELIDLCKALSAEKIRTKRQFPKEPAKEQDESEVQNC